MENAENIAGERTRLNLYWDCANGLRTHEENSRFPTFTQHERIEYERRYGAFVAGQNQRNAPVMPSAIEPLTICWGTRASARKKPSTRSAKRATARRLRC